MYKYCGEIWLNGSDSPVIICSDDSFKNVYSVCVSSLKDLESEHNALWPMYYARIFVDGVLKYRLKYRSRERKLCIRRNNPDSTFYSYVYSQRYDMETLVHGISL